MIAPNRCSHPDTVPVYAYVHPTNPQTGDPVQTVNDGQPVARLCLDCDAQLPAAWGCTDCGWTPAERRVCDPLNHTPLILTRPCPTHQEATP